MCLRRGCRNWVSPYVFARDLYGACYIDPDPQNPKRVGRPPEPNKAFTTACKEAVACAMESRCAADDPNGGVASCYCGTAQGAACLMSGRPNGPCKEKIEIASGSEDASLIGQRLFEAVWGDETVPNAGGIAGILLECMRVRCGPPCLGYDACLSDVGDPIAKCKTQKCKEEGDCFDPADCHGDLGTDYVCEQPDGGASSGADLSSGPEAPPEPGTDATPPP